MPETYLKFLPRFFADVSASAFGQSFSSNGSFFKNKFHSFEIGHNVLLLLLLVAQNILTD